MSSFASMAAIAVVSVGLGACGSSDKKSSSSGGGDALSRSALVAKIDSICTATLAETNKVKAPTDIQDPVQAAKYFDALVPLADKETADLAALKGDDEVKADLAAFVSVEQKADALVQTIRKKADAQDKSGLQDLQKLGPLGNQVTRGSQEARCDQVHLIR